jgi:hypothetical protein
MKVIKEIIQHFQRKHIYPLGRWKLEYDTRIVNHKIDMSNEDHCGPCGQYNMNKNDKNHNKIIIKNEI